MGFFDDILDNTIGRIPEVGGSISGVLKGVGGIAEKGINTATSLFSGFANIGTKLASTATNLVGGLADFVSTPYFTYILIGGAGLIAYSVLKGDGSSNNSYRSFSPPPSAYVSALAQFTPQGRIGGFASKVASAYV